MRKRRADTILALDPGLRALGYAVLVGPRLSAYGAIDLRECPKESRLLEARRHVHGWIRTHRPRTVVMEKTYGHPVPWLHELHELTLSVRRVVRRRRLRFAAYAPQRVRKSLVGNGKAKKPEVAIAMGHRFPQLRVYLTQDRRWKERFWQNMFDAVTLALHHQRVSTPPSRSR